jgi:hypothetical protein
MTTKNVNIVEAVGRANASSYSHWQLHGFLDYYHHVERKTI